MRKLYFINHHLSIILKDHPVKNSDEFSPPLQRRGIVTAFFQYYPYDVIRMTKILSFAE